MPEPRLQGTNVCVRRGGRPVVDGVDVEAHPGRILSILGPNGAGKSTLLRALGGLVDYGGSVRLGGNEIRTIEPRQRARSIALLPQRSQLAVDLSVRTVVAHGRYAHRGGLSKLAQLDRDRIDDAMETTAVTALADRAFSRLSYGEQRRVLLARALATGADTLLLDEPTASLDIAHALGLHATLRGLADRGRCVVVVLHALDDALRFTDDALLMADGRAVARGGVSQVVCAEHVEPTYGVKLGRGDGLSFHLPGEDPS